MRFQVADRVPVPEHVPPELVHDFDFLDPPGASDDVQLAWKRLHDEAPDIFWTPRNGGHWIATRGEDIREIQTNHRRFSQRVMTIPASAQVFRIPPANADPPEHDGYRRIIMPAFLPKVIDGLEEGIRDLARDLIGEFAPAVTGDMRVVLDAPPPTVQPPLKLRIEHGTETGAGDLDDLGRRIVAALHDRLKVNPSIEFVPPGTFEKTTRKTPMFERRY